MVGRQLTLDASLYSNISVVCSADIPLLKEA